MYLAHAEEQNIQETRTGKVESRSLRPATTPVGSHISSCCNRAIWRDRRCHGPPRDRSHESAALKSFEKHYTKIRGCQDREQLTVEYYPAYWIPSIELYDPEGLAV